MISAKAVLQRLNINTLSPVGAIQDVRALIEESADPLKKASKLVFDVTGLDTKFEHVITAMHVAQHVVMVAVQNDTFDPDQILLEAKKHAEQIRTKDWPYAYATVEAPSKRGVTYETVLEGSDTKVAVNSDGKIRKGWKQILAAELYQKYLKEAADPNAVQPFVQILIKELGLSKSCANTYSYNVRKSAGPLTI